MLDEIDRLLSRASAMDADLDYPWHAWAQVCGYRGIADPFAKQAEARATRAPEPDLPVGYRRGPVRITHEGWSLTIPGSLCRASHGGRVVGGHGWSKHHDRREPDHDAGQAPWRRRPSSISSPPSSARTRSTTSLARSSDAPG
ncbi:MAG: hypothetical protein WKF78_10155 [Candidatus Limnocylindrales bacterium]